MRVGGTIDAGGCWESSSETGDAEHGGVHLVERGAGWVVSPQGSNPFLGMRWGSWRIQAVFALFGCTGLKDEHVALLVMDLFAFDSASV